MDMMMLLLVMMMLPNILGGLGGFFGGGEAAQTAPNIYINTGGGQGGPPQGDEDTSYTATYDSVSDAWTYVPSRTSEAVVDDPYDLMIGGAVAGAGIGAWFSPLTLGFSALAGGVIGGAIGWVADIFI